jgi:hypothetical protein
VAQVGSIRFAGDKCRKIVMPHSLGNEPCTELETRVGIWKYDANKTGQVFSAKERYVSGIRNGEGFDFDTSGRLFVRQHGRDQLHEDWPEPYTTEQGFELPAEEVMIVTRRNGKTHHFRDRIAVNAKPLRCFSALSPSTITGWCQMNDASPAQVTVKWNVPQVKRP